MIAALVLLLALIAPAAFAQCLPKSVFPNETGTDYIVVETPYVQGRVGWCLESRTPAGDNWRQIVYQWRLKRLALPPTFEPFAVLDELRASASPLAAASAVTARFAIPLTDPVEIVRYRQWRFDACMALITPPYTLTPTPFAAGAFPAGYCGTRPADPVDVWRTVGGTIFVFSGTRLTSIVQGRKVAAGLECACSIFSVMSGGKRYCQIKPAEAAECRLVP